MSEENDDWPDTYTTFVGCTCEHPSEDHGWGECLVDGCECEGGWEE